MESTVPFGRCQRRKAALAWLGGGEFYGLPATGRAFRVPVIAVFYFDRDRITNERIYFDAASLLIQIGRSELLSLAVASD